MEEIYKLLKEAPSLFKSVTMTDENEIAITTGWMCDEQAELVLYVTQTDDNLILTDKGQMRTYMDKVFELSEPDVIKNIIAVTDYYGISTKNKQLSLELCENEEGFTEGFLKMLYCIGFLDAMKIFYV